MPPKKPKKPRKKKDEGPSEKRYTWTFEAEEKLIDFWEKNEILYDMSLREYSNTERKRRLLDRFAAELGTDRE